MHLQKNKTSFRIKLIAAGLIVFLIQLLIMPKSVFALSKTVQPTRDTYVDSSLPNSSYGNIGLGVVKHQPSDSTSSLALFYFDLSSIPRGATISSAVLKLRLGGCINSASNAGHINLAGYVTNGSPAWTESSTYAQLSTSGSSIDGFASQSISCNSGAYYDLDLAPIVGYWIDNPSLNDGLVISRINGGDYWTRVFYMREATESSRPKLTVNYEIPYESVPVPDGPPAPTEEAPSTSDTKKKASSNEIVAESTPQPIAPDETIEAVGKLSAKQDENNSGVTLSWTASNSKDIKGYRVYRKTFGEKTFKLIAEVDKSKLKYLDTKTKADAQHSYFVRVTRDGKESLNSPTATIMVRSKLVDSKAKTKTAAKNSLWMLVYILFMLLVTILIAYKILHKKHKTLHAKHKKLTSGNIKKLN